MAEHNPFSATGAALELNSRQNKVKGAVNDATAASKKAAPKKGARKKQAQPLPEIKKSKYTGSKGEPSYGQRMSQPAIGQQKTRFGQTGNSGDY